MTEEETRRWEIHQVENQIIHQSNLKKISKSIGKTWTSTQELTLQNLLQKRKELFYGV